MRFFGNWSKRRQTETSTNQNVYRPKRRQTKTSTDRNVDRPKRRQTKTSTNQNVDNRNVDNPKRRQTKTSTVHFSILHTIVLLNICFHNSWKVLHVYPYIDIIGGT